MEEFYLVRIKPSEKPIDPEERRKLGSGHHAFIENLTQTGVIKIGGPIAEKPGGMIVIKASSKDEVTTLFADDPLISRGALEITVDTWQIKHGDPSILA